MSWTEDYAAPDETAILHALAAQPDGAVLAIVTGVEGRSYRPVGAAMAFWPDRAMGSVSSGCVEGDLALRADAARARGTPEVIRYGEGSPYFDVQLPCGAGLDIAVLPNLDPAALAAAAELLAARKPAAIRFEITTGGARLANTAHTGWDGEVFAWSLSPQRRVVIFGKGPETASFAALTQAAGSIVEVYSPDHDLCGWLKDHELDAKFLARPIWPGELAADPYTAIVLFFHDHDWEPPLLAKALETDAFYIGAQGSTTAAAQRQEALSAMGATTAQLARLRGPIGLIPRRKAPVDLAVSVLAEVIAASDKATR